jgi:hypothetical protein
LLADKVHRHFIERWSEVLNLLLFGEFLLLLVNSLPFFDKSVFYSEAGGNMN